MKTERKQADEPTLTVGVIGLGLIGGSLAKALRFRWERVARLFVFDTDEDMLREADKEGLVDGYFVLTPASFTFSAPAAAALAACDLVLICTPVACIAPYARAVAAVSDALLTDVGSVKSEVMEATCGLRFIGGHPMAGSERRSFICSNEGLFENAVYVLCPPTDGSQNAEDLVCLEEMIRAIGALPRQMQAEEHDRAVAAISPLPHVVAAGLVNTAGRTEILDLAAGGFRDITRIASSDADLWTGITYMSRERLLPILDEFAAQMEIARVALQSGNRADLRAFFASASALRSNMSGTGGGALMTEALINVELEDRPGELAVIATLLGVRGISIKNMSIVHARQYEGGRLQLFLTEHHQVELAKELLTKAGYECS